MTIDVEFKCFSITVDWKARRALEARSASEENIRNELAITFSNFNSFKMKRPSYQFSSMHKFIKL